MCNWGFDSLDPWTYACCSPDNPSIYCEETEHNKCFPSFAEVNELFYTYCPLVNNTMCGTESEELVLETSIEENSFSIETLRWKDKYYKLPQYDACYYVIKNPPHVYEPGAKLKLKITEMRNLDIYLFGGENQTNAK